MFSYALQGESKLGAEPGCPRRADGRPLRDLSRPGPLVPSLLLRARPASQDRDGWHWASWAFSPASLIINHSQRLQAGSWVRGEGRPRWSVTSSWSPDPCGHGPGAEVGGPGEHRGARAGGQEVREQEEEEPWAPRREASEPRLLAGAPEAEPTARKWPQRPPGESSDSGPDPRG